MARRAPRRKDKSNGAYVARAMRNPSMQSNVVRTTIVGSGNFNSAVGSTGATLTYSYLTGLTDFISFASLFREFRVVGIEIQFLDLQPSSPIPALAGTLHSGGVLPTNGLSLVQDLPDSVNIRPYQQHSFHWRPTNIAERLYLDTSSTVDYGGFHFWSLGGTAVTAKWRYLVRYVVEFKDRV